MRKVVLWVVCMALALGAAAQVQPYGNEWIHYDREYWMFKVWKDGIHRIDSTTLAQAGFPLESVDPHTLQLHTRGRQVPIYVEGEEDGEFNTGDFIEFYAQKNDAWLDSALWDDPAHINNPYYSLYNDTIRYFLSWGPQSEAQRMVPVSSSNWEAYDPELAPQWAWGTTRNQFANVYQDGNRTSLKAALCAINEGEGYFHNNAVLSVGADAQRNYPLALPNLYEGSDAPPPAYHLSLAGVNNPGGLQCDDHHLQVLQDDVVRADTIFRGYKLIKLDLEFPANSLSPPSTVITIKSVHDLLCEGLAPDYPDAMCMAWHSIRYPRKLIFGNGGEAEIRAHPGPDSLLVQFTAGGGAVALVWAENGLHRVRPVQTGANCRAVLPPSSQDMRLVVARDALIPTIDTLMRVNGTGHFTEMATDLPDSALVIVTHTTLMEAAMAYANYRQTNPYNRYNTVVVDVEDLYDQFGGGIRHHPLAIRNYMRYIYHQAPSDPQGLFLIGKSVQSVKKGGLPDMWGYRTDPIAGERCLVPTIGWPSSDLLFGLDLAGTQPAYLSVPVGRLAARTPDDVFHYLEKVQSVESQEPAAWMKNILHFRGGNTETERAQFNMALHSFQVLAEDTFFLGKVTQFNKDGGDVIEQAAVDSVTRMIHDGVTLMTFFAHAYGGGFDITIDVPSNYDWNGRYPMVLGNSCYTGNFHLYDAASSSEQFVLNEHAGAVAFLSSSDVGLSGLLRQYSRDFYKSFSLVNYGKSIGHHIRFAVLQQLSQGTIESTNSAETMHLHGDPTLVMNSPELPDLEVTTQDITVIPEQVTAELDSFQVRVVFRNIGKGTHQPFSVALERHLVDQGITLPAQIQQVGMQAYQDTVYFTLPVHVDQAGTGANDLRIRLDLDPDLIPELDDQTNNRATLRIHIGLGSIQPVYPYDFAIIPDPAPTLKASTGDPFAPPRNYIFQIDTTDLYNSPIMEQHTLNAPGGVVEWQPSTIYGVNSISDSTVFFWRCALDSIGDGGYNWREHSFQYLPNRTGWGQSHFFQFKDDGYDLMEHVRPSRRFEFQGGTHQIGCVVWGNHFHQCYWTKDLDMGDSPGCPGGAPAMVVAVVDPFDFSAWMTRYGGVGRYYGQRNVDGSCRERNERVFIFEYTSESQLEGLANMISQEVPDGHYLLVFTYHRLDREALEDSPVMAAMEALGATNLSQGVVPDSVPYIFFSQKGDPATIQEVWGEGPTDQIDMTASVTLTSQSGAVTAPRSHVALEWEGLSWRISPMQVGDSTRVELIGVQPQGNEQPVAQWGSYTGDKDLINLVTAENYPQLRLKASLWNDSLEAPLPAQIRRWQLLGVPAPECAIDPPSGLHIRVDSLYQGQYAEVMVAVRNIGEQPMDSLLMTAWITDRSSQVHRIHYKYNQPLPVGATLRDTIRFSTSQFPGPNSMLIEANPIDTLTGNYDQPELTHFNNIANLRFLIQQDLENPMLDITFDGQHILDGDIVSAKPEIQIVLEDENQDLLLNLPQDTAYFYVFLTDPSGTMKRIYFREAGQEQMQFVPATGPKNISRVFYRPEFLQDGMYRISVRAKDKSGNNSGDRDNSISFEVINRPTITEVLNYPNPFTTNTRFVFTLTGDQVPTAMRIQIMTITGRVVREIPMAELGPLRVGRNITDFAWDGTDQFGDRLARGVYLYRVVAQLNGQDIEYRDGGAASYFKKGIGKMYLLR